MSKTVTVTILHTCPHCGGDVEASAHGIDISAGSLLEKLDDAVRERDEARAMAERMRDGWVDDPALIPLHPLPWEGGSDE